MKINQNKTLSFEEFENQSKEDWRLRAEEDLSGKSLDSLNWIPFDDNESFSLEAYYTKEDLNGLEYLKNFHNSRKDKLGWSNYLHFKNDLQDFSERIKAAKKFGDGVVIDVIDQSSLREQLHQISNLPLEIAIQTDDPQRIFELMENSDLPPVRYIISKSGAIKQGKAIASTNFTANLKYICIASKQSSIELQLLDYLEKLNVVFFDARLKHLDIDEVQKRVFIYSETGNEYFLEIAKLRSIRILTKALLQAYSFSDESNIEILSKSNKFLNENYQPHGNMIKGTYAGMAAILGGCDAVVIEPEDDTPLAQSSAYQVSNILKEESYLDQISDPAGGSYYIESITHKMVRDTWQKFIQDQASQN